ncbi:MAG: hypothetical protein E7077_08865 [Bacteroidales bacterium]|nr:hypothetical protein [Bacteroidales bacterium]
MTKVHAVPSETNHQPSIINHQPSTINLQPSIINLQPSIISRFPKGTHNLRLSTNRLYFAEQNTVGL